MKPIKGMLYKHYHLINDHLRSKYDGNIRAKIEGVVRDNPVWRFSVALVRKLETK